MLKASKPRRFAPEKILYSRAGIGVIGILVIGAIGLPVSLGQMPQLKRPEEAPQQQPQEVKPKKNVKGPRAVGLLQLNKSGKGSLIPVAIEIDGKFYDASIYKADPVPMALEGGTVYEVERDGESQGLFTIRGALHNKNPDSPTPWLGAGTYVANGTVVANTVHKAEDKPRGLDADENDAPPRLTRGKETSESSGPGSAGGGANSGASPKAGSNAGSAGNGSNSSGGAPSSNAGEGSGSAKGDTQASSTAQTSPGKPGASQGSPPQNAPAQGSPDKSSKPQGQNAQNYYRPTLRRGKPTESAPTDAEDDAALATDKLTLPTKGGTSAGGGPQTTVQLVPAISDAGGPQPESYKFFWKEGEEEDRKKQMLALAADEVRAYLAKEAKDTIPAKPVAAKTGTSKSGVRVHQSKGKVEPMFENVEFRAFDVWKNSQPVMILTADAHFPPAAASDTGPVVYNVTIAARTDIYGDLRKLYTGITDKFHLDVTPKLDLIDAVDADGDGRGELLFRETTDAGTGYLIYRATGDTLWKMFDSLNEQ
jgi:hypothetical protein